MEFKKRLLLERNLGWTPNVQPDKAEDLPDYLFSELSKLSEAMFQLKNTHLDRTTSYPPKPRDGDMTLIDDETEGGLYLYDRDHWTELNVGDSGASVPVGGIIMWTGSMPPDGWAICDGTPAPNNMETPNLVDRFVKGSGTEPVGQTGGATVTSWTSLTEDQMPRHNHTQSGTFTSNTAGDHSHTTNTTGNHNHGITAYVNQTGRHGAGGATGNRYYPNDPPYPAANTEGNHSHTTNDAGSHSHTTTISGSTTNQGKGEAHNHEAEPPFYVLAFIMRYE